MRHPGLPLHARRAVQDPLHVRRDAGLVGHDLDDRRLDAGVGDAVLDVGEEHALQGFGHVDLQARAVAAEVAGEILRGVVARGDHDVHVEPLGQGLDARDEAPQTHHGQVDERPDSLPVQGLEAVGGAGDGGVLVPLGVGVVLLELGMLDEDMLVHERRPQVGQGHRSTHGLDLVHPNSPERSSGAVRTTAPRPGSC